MERYIGLDVHAQSCTLVVLSGTGKQLKHEVVETNGAALKQALRAIPGPKRICLEEGTQSAWLYELLRSEPNVSPTFRFPDLISACVSQMFAKATGLDRRALYARAMELKG